MAQRDFEDTLGTLQDLLREEKKLYLEHLKDNDLNNSLNQIKTWTKKLCESNQNFLQQQRAVGQVEEQLEDITKDDDTVLDELFKEKLTEIRGKVKNFDYKKDNIWKAIFDEHEDVREVVQESSNNAEYERINDSIQLSSVFTPPLDPLTKTRIKNPFRNKVCKHVYEEESIQEYILQISQHRKKVKCPHIGCSNGNLKSSDFVRDETLQKQIEEYNVLNGGYSSD